MMDADFWNERWANNDIGFHEGKVNARLVTYIDLLRLTKGSRVFVPLCGKTVDIAWFLANGYRVAGAEFSELAIEQLFSELDVQPTISRVSGLTLYNAKSIDIFVGDIFDVSREILGSVDAVYDRGALVALPADKRTRYTAHLTDISNNAPQLLITCDYDSDKRKGSPYPISNEEIEKHYGKSHELTLAESAMISEGLKGITPAKAHVWILKKNRKMRI